MIYSRYMIQYFLSSIFYHLSSIDLKFIMIYYLRLITYNLLLAITHNKIIIGHTSKLHVSEIP